MITGIGHVAINCYRFEETLDFYTRVMKFDEMFRLFNDAGELWIIYLRVNDSVFLELFPQTGEAAEKDRHFSHLCLEVIDIEATVDDLIARGAPLDAAVKTGKDGNKQAWTHDPEGTRIELMELAPDSMQREAIARLQKANP